MTHKWGVWDPLQHLICNFFLFFLNWNWQLKIESSWEESQIRCVGLITTCGHHIKCQRDFSTEWWWVGNNNQGEAVLLRLWFQGPWIVYEEITNPYTNTNTNTDTNPYTNTDTINLKLGDWESRPADKTYAAARARFAPLESTLNTEYHGTALHLGTNICIHLQIHIQTHTHTHTQIHKARSTGVDPKRWILLHCKLALNFAALMH